MLLLEGTREAEFELFEVFRAAFELFEIFRAAFEVLEVLEVLEVFRL